MPPKNIMLILLLAKKRCYHLSFVSITDNNCPITNGSVNNTLFRSRQPRPNDSRPVLFAGAPCGESGFVALKNIVTLNHLPNLKYQSAESITSPKKKNRLREENHK